MGPQYLNALKHLLHYLKGSSGCGIVYPRDGGALMGCESKLTPDADSIVGYTDSDYAMDPVTPRSVQEPSSYSLEAPFPGPPNYNPASPGLPPKLRRKPFGYAASSMTLSKTSPQVHRCTPPLCPRVRYRWIRRPTLCSLCGQHRGHLH